MIFFFSVKNQKITINQGETWRLLSISQGGRKSFKWLKTSSLKINKLAFKFLFTDDFFSKNVPEKCVRLGPERCLLWDNCVVPKSMCTPFCQYRDNLCFFQKSVKFSTIHLFFSVPSCPHQCEYLVTLKVFA